MITRENFLEPEIRCDYEVTAKTKRIWKVQLDMLEEFMRICEKHGLKWQMNGGSLLGVVRHQGYIPWDDDIDVVMPRKDYDIFNKIAAAELPPHMSLENAWKNPADFGFQTRIRNNNTAQVDPHRLKRRPIPNLGIFIDILPLDEVPENMEERIQFLEKYISRCYQITYSRRRLANGLWDAIKTADRSKGFFSWLRLVLGLVKTWCALAMAGGGEAAYEKTEDILRNAKFPPGTKTVCGLTKWGAHTKRYTKVFWDPEQVWGELIDAPFEYLTVKIPKAYDDILTVNYGDWHELVRGTGLHTTLEIDPDRSYKEVLIEKYGYSPKDFQ